VTPLIVAGRLNVDEDNIRRGHVLDRLVAVNKGFRSLRSGDKNEPDRGDTQEM
jgi:hypothetical protein